MAVSITFNCGGQGLTESNPLDFGTTQAGSTSEIKTITVTNTGNSDAQLCVIEPIEASVINGFAGNLQIGVPQDTYQAQKFMSDANSNTPYSYAVLGVGKNWATKLGGTLQNTNGSDSFATVWKPPSAGASGQKVWGNGFSCVYST